MEKNDAKALKNVYKINYKIHNINCLKKTNLIYCFVIKTVLFMKSKNFTREF